MKELLRMKTVAKKVGMHPSTIYRMIEKGEFPKQIKINVNSVAWVGEEIDGWIHQKIKASRS